MYPVARPRRGPLMITSKLPIAPDSALWICFAPPLDLQHLERIILG